MGKQSNHCFPTRAVVVWHQLDNKGHMRLVESCLKDAGSFVHIRSPRRMFSDPLYAVVGEGTGFHKQGG